MNKERAPEVAVGVIVTNDKREIFLGKSTKYKDLWIIPGGHLDYGETLEECVRREIREELGIELVKISFLQVQELIQSAEYTADPGKHFIFINYTAQMADPNAGIKLSKKEYSDFCFIPPQEALEKLNLNSSTKRAISCYLNTDVPV